MLNYFYEIQTDFERECCVLVEIHTVFVHYLCIIFSIILSNIDSREMGL